MLNTKKHKNGFQLFVKDKPVKTPKQKEVIVPSKAMGELICDRKEAIKLVNAAIDHVELNREAYIDKLVQKIHTDLLCYRADHPSSLVEIQTRKWDPLLKRFKDDYDIHLEVTNGISPLKQSDESIKTLSHNLGNLNSFQLVCVGEGVGLYNSVVLSLLHLDAAENDQILWDASVLDETYQIDRWGEDAELLKSLKSRRKDLELLSAFRSSF